MSLTSKAFIQSWYKGYVNCLIAKCSYYKLVYNEILQQTIKNYFFVPNNMQDKFTRSKRITKLVTSIEFDNNVILNKFCKSK